jgi:hypothetical protein
MRSNPIDVIVIALAVALAGCGCGATPARAPEIRAEAWLNGAPPEDLHGKVVLVEFWTFG